MQLLKIDRSQITTNLYTASLHRHCPTFFKLFFRFCQLFQTPSAYLAIQFSLKQILQSMELSDTKPSKLAEIYYRSFLRESMSPLKVRQKNFMLDCVSKQSSILPTYQTQKDAFTKPYLSTLLQKVHSSNIESCSTLSPKNDFKIRKCSKEYLGGEQFKAFLSKKKESVLKTMTEIKEKGFSSCRNSPSKQNSSPSFQKLSKEKEKFFENKFSCYKINTKKGALCKRHKNVSTLYQK